MKNKFLAVYHWLSKYGQGFGNVDFTCVGNTPTIEVIREIERQIREANCFNNVVILNIIMLAYNKDFESEGTK